MNYSNFSEPSFEKNQMSLEPRLQEYMNKKKFYKQNNITPGIPVEHEFQITKEDRKLLRSYLRGNTDVYKKYDVVYNQLEKKSHSHTKKRQYFPSREFRDDPRVPEIQKNENTRNILPVNRGMFVPENRGRYYDEPETTGMGKAMLDSRDFPEFVYDEVKNQRKPVTGESFDSVNYNKDIPIDGRGFNQNHDQFFPTIDPKIDPGRERHSKYNSQFRIPPDPYTRETDPDPRNKFIISDLREPYVNRQRNDQYNGYDNGNKYMNYNTIGDYEMRGDETSTKQFDQIPRYSAASDMDLDNKVVIPNLKTTSKDLDYSDYRLESYFGQDRNTRDPDVESDLVRGMPASRAHNRSYGYRNPSENYFQYLDQDFQNPDNSVMGFPRGGEATRLDNKKMAKNQKYERRIM
jgi:hypothetical protein